ncbi:DUF6351 family protein [Pendulispora albinea]|uniref:DUF6351 family protein n=1 Tax=Pendulispora albinea TaxID=2741071 RepID=A0ABZ2LXX7_9BACT
MMAHFRSDGWLLVLLVSLVHCAAPTESSGDDPSNLSGSGETSAGPKVQTHLVRADYHTRKTPPLGAGEFDLITLSALPNAVTGGDVLIGLRGLAGADGYALTRNGVDVTASLQRLATGEVRGLVTGLELGDNELIATARGPSGTRRAVLTVTNHPITGPVVSGPHQSPFLCQTLAAGLGEPIDANCSVATRYEWFYRTALTQEYKKLADPYAPYPADAMRTVTQDGKVVPFVVRVESATINRGITRIAVLDDPRARGREAPFDARGWNHRVYYAFGASCGTGYHQGTNGPGDVLGGIGDLLGLGQRLAKGDVVVHSTLSSYGVHCNPLISIETTSMVKEHIHETYGLIDDMVGAGASGGALQQYNAINNAPGLLSAALPAATFSDILSTAMTVADCGLLMHYYNGRGWYWDPLKRALVEGHNLLSGTQLNSICQSWTSTFLPTLDPKNGCDGSVPQALRYDPVTNPGGVRCTLQDANVNIFGRDPKTGFARRPLDNTGVQYGLDAFNHYVISAAEFLDLNRYIGGYDIDGKPSPQRMKMDPEVEARSYRIGGVVGRGAMAETPVMDLAPYLDLIPLANIHEAVRPFTVRARLRANTGQDATQSIWRGILTQPDAYPVMEKWFPTLRDLPYGADRVKAVREAKPREAGDRCVISTLGGRLELPNTLFGPLGVQLPLLPGLSPIYLVIPLKVDVPEDFDSGLGPCSTLLPVTRTPRMVAGMPMSDDVIRCQLKPLDRRDYKAFMTDAQFAELRSIFPDGVCDWSKPAAGAVDRSMLWPSIGGANPHEPAPLDYWVARSLPMATGAR